MKALAFYHRSATTKGHQALGRQAPKRTFTEMAEEFGVTPGVLKAAMTNSSLPAPKPSLASLGYARVNWYDPKAFRAWWKAHQAAEAEKAAA